MGGKKNMDGKFLTLILASWMADFGC